MSAVAVGIDLGGTGCRICLIDDVGTRLAAAEFRHELQMSQDALLDLLVRTVKQVTGQSTPVGAGVGVAGWVDDRGMIVSGMTNIPSLASVSLVKWLQAALNLPIRLENDARAAMIGEARYGAARGFRDAMTVTLGTGIGSGLMLDGQIRRGSHGSAGEIGLMRSVRSNRNEITEWAALEDLASPGGLSRTAGTSMEKLVSAANGGDADARGTLESIYDLLGISIANIHVMLDLQLVLLSGGMAKIGADLVLSIAKRFRHHCPVELRDGLRLDLAQLGEWAGAMGAASLWITPSPQAL